jgi:hypothetical protein
MRPIATYLLLLLLSVSGLNAQEPGIQGRKLIVAVVGTIAPPAVRSYLSSDFAQQRRHPVLGASLQLEYVVNRRNSINLQLTPSSSYYYNTISESFVHEQASMVGFKGRKYSFDRTGNLAPMGMFIDYGLALLRYKSSFYAQVPPDGAAPDEITVRFEPYFILGLGRAWLQRRVWGEYSLQFVYNGNLPIYGNPGLVSRMAQLNAVTLRLGIGLLN